MPRVSKSASGLYSCFGPKAAVSAACWLLLVAVMAKRSGMGSGDRGPGTIDGMAIWRFIDGRVVGEWWVSGTLNALTRLFAYSAKGPPLGTR